MVKNLPAMQETQVPPLDLEDPLEKERATHSSILAWRIPGTEEPGRLQSKESDTTEWLTQETNTGTWLTKLQAVSFFFCSRLQPQTAHCIYLSHLQAVNVSFPAFHHLDKFEESGILQNVPQFGLVWHFFPTYSSDPEIPVMRIYFTDILPHLQNEGHTRLFTRAIFNKSKTWQITEWPPWRNWLN